MGGSDHKGQVGDRRRVGFRLEGGVAVTGKESPFDQCFGDLADVAIADHRVVDDQGE